MAVEEFGPMPGEATITDVVLPDGSVRSLGSAWLFEELKGMWSFVCPRCGIVVVTPADGEVPVSEAESLAVRAEHLERHRDPSLT